MEGKGGFKERWNCSLRKPEMYEPRKLREESVWRRGLISLMLHGYQRELSTLDLARSLEIFKSNIRHKGYGAMTTLRLKKGWWWCGNHCELNKSSPGHDLHKSSASVAGTACLFENLCLSICDRVLVNWNASDLMSNWVTLLPYIFNSLPHLVAFLVHQNIDWNN